MAYLDLARTLVSDRERELRRVAQVSRNRRPRSIRRGRHQAPVATSTVLVAPVVRTAAGAIEPGQNQAA